MATTYEKNLMRQWGENLEKTRIERGFSGPGGRRLLADSARFTVPTIYRIEKGQRFPSESTKLRLAAILRVPVGDLFPYGQLPPTYQEVA